MFAIVFNMSCPLEDEVTVQDHKVKVIWLYILFSIFAKFQNPV